MRVNPFIALSAAALAILAACNQPTSGGINAYVLKAAPKAITVDVPKSLVKPSMAPKSLILSRDLSAGGWFNDENRGAYHWVKETMWRTQKSLARAATRMVLLDTIIASEGLVPGAAAAPTQHDATAGHVWTAEEVAAIQALLPPSFASSAAFSSEAKIPAAGDKASMPAFDYSLVDKETDTLNAAFDIKVTLLPEPSEDDSSNSIVVTRSYYWTADKSQFKYVQERSDTSGELPAALESNFVAYDAGTGTMAAGRQSDAGSMNLQVKADAASTANGVFINFSSTVLPDKADEYKSDEGIASGSTFSFSASGYADNQGGTILETFIFTPSSGSPLTYYFKEGFAADGSLTFAAVTDAAGNVIATVDGIGQAGATDRYSGKEDEVATQRSEMDSSGAAAAVRGEERHHAGDIAGSGLELEFAVPDGQAAPAVGETWAVSDTASDFGAGHLLGSGVVTEPGHILVTFAAPPPDGTATLYIAKSDAGVPDLSNVIEVSFGS